MRVVRLPRAVAAFAVGSMALMSGSEPTMRRAPLKAFFQYSLSRLTTCTAPPLLGENGTEILQALGYDDATIQRLRANGTV